MRPIVEFSSKAAPQVFLLENVVLQDDSLIVFLLYHTVKLIIIIFILRGWKYRQKLFVT
jgi:hypothetical protein